MIRPAATLCVALLLGGCQLDGHVRVIDGDTVNLGGKAIRLYGIDAPELAQHCGDPPWPCGRAAAAALTAIIDGRPLRCISRDHDRYGRVVAHCFVGGADISAAMVAGGWAVAFTRYSTAFVAIEETARSAGTGIWSGTFTAPTVWRQEQHRAP